MYRTIREQGDHLVQLALERDQAVLELDQVELELAVVRTENEDLHSQLTKYYMAKQYTTKFSKTLAKAAPNLFTFVLCDVEPTYTPR